MTTWKAYEPRAAGDVPWNRDRERRVLGGALRSWRRRARQKRALELLTVVGSILLMSRFLPRLPVGVDGTGGALGASGAEHPPAVELAPAAELSPRAARAKAGAPQTEDTQVSSTPQGLAGSGGHGGGTSQRIGGGAGTG
jgi:hypothetical protein